MQRDPTIEATGPAKKPRIEGKVISPSAHFSSSVVRIEADSATHSYKEPWREPGFESSIGSGFVLNYKGNTLILTNAHVAATAVNIRVRLANSDKHYSAQRMVANSECDLAVLKVSSPEFQQKATALELGEEVGVGSQIQIVGFADGRDKICITGGQISRFEMMDYVTSGLELLALQVDAAMHHGNSGGPAVMDGKVIGVSFQGSTDGAGDNHIIPIPVIKQFLDDYLEHNAQGIPHLNIDFQDMEEALMRKTFGMQEHHSGVRIAKIAKTSHAYGILQKNDVLLAIDDCKIRNNGDIEITHPETETVAFTYLTSQKFIGDEITFTVLRGGQELSIKVPLKERFMQSHKVHTRDFGQAPTFYINCGLVFQPLTVNYLEEKNDSDLAHVAEEYKKNANDEVVFLNQVLPYQATEEYKHLSESVVKKVNGKAINNLHELIENMEQHTGESHIILLKNNRTIVIPRLSEGEQQEMLEEKSISRRYSQNLADKIEDLVEKRGDDSALSDIIPQNPRLLQSVLNVVEESDSDSDQSQHSSSQQAASSSASCKKRKRENEGEGAAHAQPSPFASFFSIGNFTLSLSQMNLADEEAEETDATEETEETARGDSQTLTRQAAVQLPAASDNGTMRFTPK